MRTCQACERDRAFLTSRLRPPFESGGNRLRVVDLFAGCGGLSLGIALAARGRGLAFDVRLAVDADPDAVAGYKANFPNSVVRRASVQALFDGELGSDPSAVEAAVRASVGEVDVLAGGPPCQGHSDLNNHTRRDDERNALYAIMARAAEVLDPSVILVENVPTAIHDVADVVGLTRRSLQDRGYTVEDRVIDLVPLGVPQRRRRHVLLGYRGQRRDILANLRPACPVHTARTVEWAISDLAESAPDGAMDRPSRPTPTNAARMAWLIEHDEHDLPNALRPPCHQSEHSYRSMYGRLRWDQPAQTVTTGFGSMGQGRFVHPATARTITAHEAARLQTIPDFFDFSLARTRGSLARLIGNAVPPGLPAAILEAVELNSKGLLRLEPVGVAVEGEPREVVAEGVVW